MNIGLSAVDQELRGESARSGRVLTLRGFGLLAFALSALVVLAATWLEVEIPARRIEHLREQLAEAKADDLAQRLAAFFERYDAIAAQIARDRDVQRMLRSTVRADLLGEKAQALAKLLPEVWLIRLLLPGVREIDTRVMPHLGFATLDMLRQAEANADPPPVEVHHYGQDQQHIVMVRRLPGPSGEGLLGMIQFTFRLRLLEEQVGAFGKDDVHLELWQINPGGQRLRLATSGESSPSEEPIGVSGVPRTAWVVAYWARPPRGMFTSSSIVVFVVGGLTLALLGLVSMFVFSRLGQILRADLVTMVELVRDLTQGRVQSQYAARLEICAGAMETQRSLAAAQPSSAGADTKEPPDRDKAMVDTPAPMAAGVPSAQPSRSFMAGQRPLSELGLVVTDGDAESVEVSPSLFRGCDIQGVAGGELSSAVVYEIGLAIGSEAHERGEDSLAVARDGRLSSPELLNALKEALADTGSKVIDLGLVPSPVLYFATEQGQCRSGVMVTASHAPSERNGLKIVLGGKLLDGEDLAGLRSRIERREYRAEEGTQTSEDVASEYISYIANDVPLARPFKVVLDCGNGATGEIGARLLRALGCEVVGLNCEVDGRFPNHLPDPGRPENLVSVTQAVRQHGADLGVAFDGDGDRLVVIDSGGQIIWPDRLLMLLASDVLAREPGSDILFDVKSTRHLPGEIVRSGGRPVMTRGGCSAMRSKLKKTGALMAGEFNGRIFIAERWFGFEDGLYACARVLEILSADMRTSAEVFADLPSSFATPQILLPLPDGASITLVERILKDAKLPSETKRTNIDGLRVDFEDGWGLVRASPCTPDLEFRFEGESTQALARIQGFFRSMILDFDSTLSLPF
jgi:phosphomannomutase/phosphoglucomutase